MSTPPEPAAPRCAAASAADAEPLAGTAPTDDRWVLLEHPGPWGRKAVAQSGLPDDVVALLGGLAGARAQLVRRPDRAGRDGSVRRLLAARRTATGLDVTARDLGDVRELLDLDDAERAALADGRVPGGAPVVEPTWLVCTNGRRDVCCAELGRPVVRALAERWPAGTWETTHLGGHRFSATLLALPSGVALGRLDPAGAVGACAELAAGRVPLEVARGDAGLSARAQAAVLAVRERTGVRGVGDVRVVDESPDAVVVEVAARERWSVGVEVRRGAPRLASCGDAGPKSVAVVEVVEVAPVVRSA